MISQLEAHLILRALKDGDPHRYAALVLKAHEPTAHLQAAPYQYCLCTACGIIHLQVCACPVMSGCSNCYTPEFKGQQYWIYHSNMLHYFANLTLTENTHVNEALETMWRLQENVSV